MYISNDPLRADFHALARRGAAFIARDQNGKATATVLRVKAGLGTTEAV